MGKHAEQRHSIKGKIIATLAALSLTGVVGVGVTTSAFSDQATTQINIEAGTIDLYANTDGTDKKEAVFDLGVGRWYPGASSTSTFVLKNKGTLPLEVDMTTGTSNGAEGLAQKLQTTISNGATVLSAAGSAATSSFTGLNIPSGGSVTLTVITTWTPGADDDAWQGKTDTVTYTFSAVNV